MCLQEYQAEGRSNTPTKARLAATIKDWVGSGLPDPPVKYWTALVRAIITAAPNSRNAAKKLNTHWIIDDQLSGDLTGWLVTCEVDIIRTIFPGCGLKFQLLERKRSFFLDGHTEDFIAWGKIGTL
jgi:hypothetical protein